MTVTVPFSDNFERANGPAGSPWELIGLYGTATPTFTILSGAAYLTSGAEDIGLAAVDTGLSDVHWTGDLFMMSGEYACPAFRFGNPNQGLTISFTPGTTANIALWAESIGKLAEASFPLSSGVQYTAEVIVEGVMVTVLIDSTLVFDHDLTGPAAAHNGTKHGVYTWHNAHNADYRRIVVAGITPPIPVAIEGMTLRDRLNQLAGTDGLSSQGAANVWAGTDGLTLMGALNVKAGTDGVPVQGVLNILAGTDGLGKDEAARRIGT